MLLFQRLPGFTSSYTGYEVLIFAFVLSISRLYWNLDDALLFLTFSVVLN